MKWFKFKHKTDVHRVAGPKAEFLLIFCISMLCLFVFIILGLIFANIAYLFHQGTSFVDVLKLFMQKKVVNGMKLSAASSLVTLALIIVTAIPIGYALSRFRFPGYTFVNTLVEVPIVLPPVVMGISLLAFFSFGPGEIIKDMLKGMGVTLVSGVGIVICQYLVSISYCIRSVKAAFDSVSPQYEHVALTLGCSKWQAFWKVALPLSRSGTVAGCIMAWARAIGIFGPLMVFVGTGPRVLVMPTALWLELSIGNIETAIAIALIMLLLAGTALAIVHFLVPEGGVV